MTTPSLPLADWSLARLLPALREGSVSPAEAVDACLARIDARNPGLDAFLRVDAEAARRQAAATRADGQGRAALQGVPYALKDNIDVAGQPTTCHSGPRAQAVAGRDSAVKQALDQAGGILLGKNSLHELATGGPSFDLPWPPARNPWDRARHPGGSSSGSAVAVASGMAYFAIGTDTSGSVRNPATACGIYGFKPSFGAIAMDGIVPLASSLDHAGVLARGARDLAIVMATLARRAADRRAYAAVAAEAATAPVLAGKRIGVIDAFSSDLDADPAIQAAFAQTLARLRDAGCTLVPVRAASLERYTVCGRTMLSAEAYTYFGAAIDADPAAYGERTRTRIGKGRDVALGDYVRMRDLQRALRTELADALADVDAAVSLSSLQLPCAIDDVDEIARTYDQQARTPFNVAGLPALSAPCGVSSGGLPLGVHVAAGEGRDAELLALVMAMEEAGVCGFVPPPAAAANAR